MDLFVGCLWLLSPFGSVAVVSTFVLANPKRRIRLLLLEAGGRKLAVGGACFLAWKGEETMRCYCGDEKGFDGVDFPPLNRSYRLVSQSGRDS